MAIGGSSNDAFGAGTSPVTNLGRGNDNSVTLSGGLQATADRWNAESQQAATTPHSVLAPYAFSRSANGSDGQNMLPNGAFLGSGNGQSADTFDQSLALRFAGGGTDNI
jgi:hypothetical protein